jgi:hypothetical protein
VTVSTSSSSASRTISSLGPVIAAVIVTDPSSFRVDGS